MKYCDIATGMTFDTRDGEIEVISVRSYTNITIKFLETGFERAVDFRLIKSGLIRDYYKPSVCGVGYLGHGRHRAGRNGSHTKAYSVWHDMINRCYSERQQIKQPSYIGCSVCEDWHNFQNFADWYEENSIDGFHLDKDIMVNGNRVYSPEFCQFVSPSDNAKKANEKTLVHYDLIDPDGNVHSGFNCRELCQKYGLLTSCISDLLKGKRKTHKGWRLNNGD